jgi:hypothetical protein
MTKKAAPATAEEGKKTKRLTPKQWAEAEALWASGEVTLGQLASKFGIAEQSIHRHMRQKGIEKGADAAKHKKKVAEAVTAAAVDDATILAGRIRETKEEHYKMSAAIAKLAWQEILTAKQNGSPVAVAMNNLKALDNAMNVMTKARIERWAVLGLDRADYVDEDGLPELLISELTADQIQELRDRDFNEFEELPAEAVQIDAGEVQDDADDGVVEEE